MSLTPPKHPVTGYAQSSRVYERTGPQPIPLNGKMVALPGANGHSFLSTYLSVQIIREALEAYYATNLEVSND